MMNMPFQKKSAPSEDSGLLGMADGNDPDEEYAVEAVKNLKDLLARGLADEIFRKICPSAANSAPPQEGEQDEGMMSEKETE
jgi:hypothetical protein